MQGGFSFLARRRWAGVGLALLVQAALLVGLAYADPAAVVGIPAAVAAAVAGTVAVVFGPWDGALVAACGAAVFVVAGSSEPGEWAALAVWPAIVVPVGLFARRVARHRIALAELITAHELERQRLALELHDETAQTLAAALMRLKAADQAASPADAAATNAELRGLLVQTIQRVRALAVHLRPKALDDFGLTAALQRLAESFSEQTGIAVEIHAAADIGRLASEAELTLYRVVQEALTSASADRHACRVTIGLERTTDVTAMLIEDDGHDLDTTIANGSELRLAGLRDRLGLLGGRLTVTPRTGGGTTIRAEIPCAT